MNAAETIAKAIEKLEGLSANSTSRPWRTHEGPEWFEVRGSGGEQVNPYADYDDAELIVTLHRTIDAQLAILRDAIGVYNISVTATQRPPHGVDDEGGIFYRRPDKAAQGGAHHVRHALALATAILGEEASS